MRYRQSFDWPIAFASVALTMSGDRVQGARVVLGAVAPVPWRSEAAEQALAGKVVTEADRERRSRRRRRGGEADEPQQLQGAGGADGREAGDPEGGRRMTNHPAPSSRLVNASHCTHLRHKGMYTS